MHNLALELNALGHTISGSDDEIFEPAKSRLQSAGILPETFGWFTEKITKNLDGVILGMHAKLDNPELIKAQELGLSIWSFPEFIYQHAQDKKRVVLAGSHGKTTCTAMLMHILSRAGISFDYLVGSLITGYDRMVKLSDAPIMIIEGDEYLSSPLDLRSKFLHYKPHLALITGIAWDHVNVFPTLDSYHSTFNEFLNSVTEKAVFYQGDDVLKTMCENNANSTGYQAPDFQKSQTGTVIKVNGETIEVPFFGKHNIENAAGVVEIAVTLGIDRKNAWQYLSDFPGTAKRLECIQKEGIEIIYRDFAHAPSKVAATVAAVREQFPERKMLSVFELHTYSSLQPDFMESYNGLFAVSDEAWVLFDPHVFELKRMPVPATEEVKNRLGNVRVFNSAAALELAYEQWKVKNTELQSPAVSLWMSSGNFGGVKIV